MHFRSLAPSVMRSETTVVHLRRCSEHSFVRYRLGVEMKLPYSKKEYLFCVCNEMMVALKVFSGLQVFIERSQ